MHFGDHRKLGIFFVASALLINLTPNISWSQVSSSSSSTGASQGPTKPTSSTTSPEPTPNLGPSSNTDDQKNPDSLSERDAQSLKDMMSFGDCKWVRLNKSLPEDRRDVQEVKPATFKSNLCKDSSGNSIDSQFCFGDVECKIAGLGNRIILRNVVCSHTKNDCSPSKCLADVSLTGKSVGAQAAWYSVYNALDYQSSGESEQSPLKKRSGAVQQ